MGEDEDCGTPRQLVACSESTFNLVCETGCAYFGGYILHGGKDEYLLGHWKLAD